MHFQNIRLLRLVQFLNHHYCNYVLVLIDFLSRFVELMNISERTPYGMRGIGSRSAGLKLLLESWDKLSLVL